MMRAARPHNKRRMRVGRCQAIAAFRGVTNGRAIAAVVAAPPEELDHGRARLAQIANRADSEAHDRGAEFGLDLTAAGEADERALWPIA